MKRTISRKLRNKSKKCRKNRHKKRCGCKMMGGNINPASFQPFQQHQNQYHYDVNTYVNDPNDQSITMSSRNLPDIIGGKKRRNTKRRHKMRGGNVDFFLGNGSSNNALTSFGSIDGALMGKSIISGQQLTDGSVFNQPAYSTYNANSMPLA
jgi:hypothetical protein